MDNHQQFIEEAFDIVTELLEFGDIEWEDGSTLAMLEEAAEKGACLAPILLENGNVGLIAVIDMAQVKGVSVARLLQGKLH